MAERAFELDRDMIRSLPEEIEEELYPYEAPPPMSDGEIHHDERESILYRLKIKKAKIPSVKIRLRSRHIKNF